MSGEGKFISGVLVGLGLAYILDPDRGSRRRALVRDKAVHAGRKLTEGVGSTARDLRNRTGGAAAELRSRLKHEDVDDETLAERVRSAIGRAVSHSGGISVSVYEGRVTLQGQVPEDELWDLLRTVRRVRGVSEVNNELQIHREPGNAPSLQGRGSQEPRG
jgi:osmotically-inducible protein OsmY